MASLGHAERVGAASAVATFSIYPEGGQGADLAASPCDVSPAVTSTDGGKQSERGVRVVSFDLAQVTHPENRDPCTPGAPAPTLASTGRAHVAFSVAAEGSEARDHAAHETDVARTLDSNGGFAAGQGGTVVAAEVAPTLTARNIQHAGGASEAEALVQAFDHRMGSDPKSYPVRAGDYAGTCRTHGSDSVLHAGVRRLTPRECERLQGLPDDWTLIEGATDAKRYKAIGNAGAVPVIEWIGRRIAQLVEGRELGPASWEVR